MPLDLEDLDFRDATPADRYCAECDFLASLRKSRDAGLIARSRWNDVMRPEVERLLAPPARIIVAYNPEMPPETKADIYGWLALRTGRTALHGTFSNPNKTVLEVTPPLVLWVYVKSHWRGRKIASALFEQAGLNPFTDRFDFVARSEMLWDTQDGRVALIRRMPGARWAWREAREDRGHAPKAADPRSRPREAAGAARNRP